MTNLLQFPRRPDITLYHFGRIIISARIVKALSLDPGDAINITIHEGEYLLYAIHQPFGRHEAQCYPSKRGSHNFCANSVRLSRALLNAAKVQTLRASFLAGDLLTINDKKYIPIITAHPIRCS
ncbi:MAG: AbrB/MazE/SpoVT family DNA-binding domain-containing protein [Muribaculaceae bacterium]|nr:AbrB/MazE/SpoVT family DNA-binding domain-containing protein [Muribaculaceae bacterium]